MNPVYLAPEAGYTTQFFDAGNKRLRSPGPTHTRGAARRRARGGTRRPRRGARAVKLDGNSVVVDGKTTDEFKGSVFLLPTVSKEEADASYPGYHTCDVPSKIEYLRLVKQDQV